MNSLFSLFYSFFSIGLFSFGGGYAMLPLIFQTVQRFGMMTQHEFSQLVALSQATPGPVAVNAATYVGFLTAGFPGAVAATFGVALPSFILVLTAMHFLEKFEESKGLQAAISGIRPVTVGMVASAAIYTAETVLTKGPFFTMAWRELGVDYINLIPCLIFAVALLLAGKFKISPIKVMLVAAICGAFFVR